MKSYIIRLKGNSISEKYASECVSQAKNFGLEVDFFDAIKGDEYESHLKKLKIKPRYKFKKGRAGVFGCFLSHYYLWEKCANQNEPFLILEHDGFVIRSLPDKILDSFTDVLKLDNHDPFSKKYNEIIKQEETNDLTVQKYINPKCKFLEKNQTGNYLRGAYSYIIKPNAARKIINWIAVNGFVPADQQIGDAIVDVKVTVPTIARLHPDYFKKIGSLSLTSNPELL